MVQNQLRNTRWISVENVVRYGYLLEGTLKKSLSLKMGMLVVIVVPFLGFLEACWVAYQTWSIRPIDVIMLVALVLATGFSITVGYHRHFTHKSFETTRKIKQFFAIFGAAAWEGGILTWAPQHKKHHANSDRIGDLHSPHKYRVEYDDETLWGTVKGLAHAHMGWLITSDDDDPDLIPPYLLEQPDICFISRNWYWFAILGLILPAILGGLWDQSWNGAWLGFLWGGLVRVFFVNHITFGINSICHMFGKKHYQTPTRDESRDNTLMAIVGLGEGSHNTHHAFPWSAKHGLDGQPDASYRLIEYLEKRGQAWDVQVPSKEQIERLRLEV